MTPQGWAGGFDTWGDRSFLLPGGTTKEDFKRAVAGFAAGTSDGPVNPDKSPANLYRAYPVAVAPGVYEFYSQSGDPIRTKSGKVFRVPVGEK
jgi:hypothetical protein